MLAARLVWALSISCLVQPWIVSGQSAEVRESDIEGEGFIANFYCREDITNRTGVLFLGGSEGPAGRARTEERLTYWGPWG